MKLFPTSIITVITLLPDHHLIFLQSRKSSDPSVVWLDMCIILSKIAHQMWCDHPSSQKNRTTERTAWTGVLGDREVGEGWKKFEKGGLSNIGGGGGGGLQKKGCQHPVANYVKRI